MYTNKVKRIAAVHDLSGFGRVSLTVVIPILSSMGFQVCPLPTAVLSSHTQYPEFSILDLTDEMPRIIAEWKKLDVQLIEYAKGNTGKQSDKVLRREGSAQRLQHDAVPGDDLWIARNERCRKNDVI